MLVIQPWDGPTGKHLFLQLLWYSMWQLQLTYRKHWSRSCFVVVWCHCCHGDVLIAPLPSSVPWLSAKCHSMTYLRNFCNYTGYQVLPVCTTLYNFWTQDGFKPSLLHSIFSQCQNQAVFAIWCKCWVIHGNTKLAIILTLFDNKTMECQDDNRVSNMNLYDTQFYVQYFQIHCFK